jgi:hypothetical protein
MNSYKILKKINLSNQHKPTGKTKHYRAKNFNFSDREELPSPSSLQIVQFLDDPGYYLLYFDKQGEELTDTYHESIEKAMDQANFEFNILPHEWKSPHDL